LRLFHLPSQIHDENAPRVKSMAKIIKNIFQNIFQNIPIKSNKCPEIPKTIYNSFHLDILTDSTHCGTVRWIGEICRFEAA
jgi:hypothetical protein